MKTFSVPVVVTTSGWLEILAESLAAAKNKAQEINDTGYLNLGDIKDSDTSYECMVDEAEELYGEGKEIPECPDGCENNARPYCHCQCCGLTGVSLNPDGYCKGCKQTGLSEGASEDDL